VFSGAVSKKNNIVIKQNFKQGEWCIVQRQLLRNIVISKVP